MAATAAPPEGDLLNYGEAPPYTALVSSIDYESFRAKSWAERLSIFNAISAEERAELVRTHISKWLNMHRDELSGEQIAILEETIAFISPELYTAPRDEGLVRQFLDLANRTAMLLSREQVREALTMHWDRACATAAR